MDLEDLLAEYEREAKRKAVRNPWQEPEIPTDYGRKGGGVAGGIGSIAQIAGMVASMIPGGQVVGVPLTLGGSALKGAATSGVGGALKETAKSGLGLVGGKAIGSFVEGLKSPVDTGATTAYSSTGAPLTVPGVRENPISVFSSQGKGMTVPASPRALMGGS